MFRAEAFIVKNLKKNYRTSRSVKAVTKDSADFLMQCALGEKLNSRENLLSHFVSPTVNARVTFRSNVYLHSPLVTT